jgi:hypothetical protein
LGGGGEECAEGVVQPCRIVLVVGKGVEADCDLGLTVGEGGVEGGVETLEAEGGKEEGEGAGLQLVVGRSR